MKSKQINFYITSEDVSEINGFLKDSGCLLLKGNIKKNKDDYTYEIVTDIENIFQVYLCNEEYKDRLNVKYLESNDYYLDILKSYCVEFDIGGFYPYSNKELHRSRFYYIFEYYDEGKLVKKDIEFINWADNFLKNFKKKFLHKSDILPKLLLSNNCLDWVIANNAKLAGGGMKLILI